ncbi:MAG: peptidylprolyl isomerase [Planktomarina sp.]|nr:peptidylprolyl isomerase [Planktomarina sp.]
MLPQRSLMIATMLATMLSWQANAQEPNLNTIVATVNDTTLTVGHVLDIKRRLPDQYQNVGSDILFTNIVDQLVQQQILASSFKKDPEWVSITMENERRNILSTIIIDDISEKAVSDEILKTAYLQKYDKNKAGKEYKASHILVDTMEKAKGLVRLLEGGASFGELAKEYSIGPSGPGGGDLGWFKKGQMVKPFETAVLDMEIGTYSRPVQTQFGFHLIQLDGRRKILPPKFEDVRGNLEIELQNLAIDTYLRELMINADVIMPKTPIDFTKLLTLDLQVK